MKKKEINVVQWYDKEHKELTKAQILKSMIFVDHLCVKRFKKGWLVLPLNIETYCICRGKFWKKLPIGYNYNFTDYYIFADVNGRLMCECQGWKIKNKKVFFSKDGNLCSHTMAVKIFEETYLKEKIKYKATKIRK